MEAGETCLGKSRVRCLPTNLALGQGAIRRAAGIERRASLVTTTSGGRTSRVLVKAAPTAAFWLKPPLALAG